MMKYGKRCMDKSCGFYLHCGPSSDSLAANGSAQEEGVAGAGSLVLGETRNRKRLLKSAIETCLFYQDNF